MAWGVGRPLQCLVSKTPWYAQRVLRVAVTNGVVHPRTKRRQNTIEPESRDSPGCLLLQYCCSLASGQSWRSRMNKEKVKGFWKKRERRFDEVFFGWCSTGEYVGIMDISVSYVFIFVHLNFGYSNFEYPRRIYFIWLYFYINFYIYLVSANIIVKVRNGDMYKSANN